MASLLHRSYAIRIAITRSMANDGNASTTHRWEVQEERGGPFRAVTDEEIADSAKDGFIFGEDGTLTFPAIDLRDTTDDPPCPWCGGRWITRTDARKTRGLLMYTDASGHGWTLDAMTGAIRDGSLTAARW